MVYYNVKRVAKAATLSQAVEPQVLPHPPFQRLSSLHCRTITNDLRKCIGLKSEIEEPVSKDEKVVLMKDSSERIDEVVAKYRRIRVGYDCTGLLSLE
jgi:hypothetical protein